MRTVFLSTSVALALVGCGLSDPNAMVQSGKAASKGDSSSGAVDVGFFSCWMTYDETSRNLTIKAFLRSGLNDRDNLRVEEGSVTAGGVALQPDEKNEYSAVVQQDAASMLSRKCAYAGTKESKSIDLQAPSSGVGEFDRQVSISEGLALHIDGEPIPSDQGGIRVQIRRAGGGAVVGEWGSWQGFPAHVRLTEDATPGAGYELTAWRGTYLRFDGNSTGMAVAWSGEYTSAPIPVTLVP